MCDEEDDNSYFNDMTNIALRMSQINKEPIPLMTYQKRPEYIINALKKKDESFYIKGTDDKIFKGTNVKDYPIFLYSTCYFKYINTYLRLEKFYEYESSDWFPKRLFSLNELNSWIWCLHKELTNRDKMLQMEQLLIEVLEM